MLGCAMVSPRLVKELRLSRIDAVSCLYPCAPYSNLEGLVEVLPGRGREPIVLGDGWHLSSRM